MESLAPSAKQTSSLAARVGLKSKWPVIADLSGNLMPCRFEGEIGDVLTYGDIPREINGTFYRIALDQYTPKVITAPIDADGTVSAFRIHDGRVDFKIKYVESERYSLERRAQEGLIRIVQEPLVAPPLQEAANPYEIDPNTLDTLRYDPFYDQVQAKAFTAHPKVDPFREELVIFGYEAKGPGSVDVVTWALGKDGKKTEENWIKSPFSTLIHDCGITENFLVLMAWPFECDVEKMKAGGQHWAYRYDRPSMFLVVPRRKESPSPGWKLGEYRTYTWRNCMNLHTAGSWEKDGKIYIEATRVHDNVFSFWPASDGRVPTGKTEADFVRWEIDPSQPSDSGLPDPEVILDMPSEFPRIDERYTGIEYNTVFINVFLARDADGADNLYHGLNALAKINKKTGEKQFFYPGNQATVQESIFIPRSKDASEGDGWVMAMVEQRATSHCELVVLDTNAFTNPIAIAQLPFRVKSQVHGNWVEEKDLGFHKSLVAVPKEKPVSGKGALEPL